MRKAPLQVPTSLHSTLPGQMEKQHIMGMASTLNMLPDFVFGVVQKLSKKLPIALAETVATLNDGLRAGDAALATRIVNYIEKKHPIAVRNRPTGAS